MSLALVIYKRHRFDIYSNLKADIRIVQDNAETIILNDNHGIKGKGVRFVDIQLMEMDNTKPLIAIITEVLSLQGCQLFDYGEVVRIDKDTYNLVCKQLKKIMSSDDKFYTCLREVEKKYSCSMKELEELEPVKVEPTEDEKIQHTLVKEFLNLWEENSLSENDTIYLELE
jgi:hypothetical protein